MHHNIRPSIATVLDYILLLMRIVLVTIHVISDIYLDDEQNTFHYFIALISFVCFFWGWATGGMYVKWPLTLLEGSFTLNIGILALVSLHTGIYIPVEFKL